MRIRKGLLLSSRMSETTSDPQLKHSVQPTTWSHELHPIRFQEKPKTQTQPSDPSIQPPNILGNTTSHRFEMKQKIVEQVELEEASKDEGEENEAGTRKRKIILAAAPVTETVSLTPLSSRPVGERRFDVGNNNIPMNKRKGVDVELTSQETSVFEKAKKMRTKSNKNCSATSVQKNDGEQDKAGNDDTNSTKKTNKRGGAIMEGSRCSRVNGRGWRCCQQTLVGYSLCEHHLGKGRLRSIANVKGRAKMPTAPAVPAPYNDSTDNATNLNQPSQKVVVSSSEVQPARDYNKEAISLDDSYDNNEDREEDEDDDDYNDHEEMKKALVVRKKRMKLGMVKARSLSSLLNQTNNAVVVASDDTN